jgi:hypothetical protein
MALGRRVRTFRFGFRDIGFVANHAGAWLLFVGIAFGGSDLENMKMIVREGETSDRATGLHGTNPVSDFGLPFRLKLVDFHMEEYPPELYRIDLSDGSPVRGRGSRIEVSKGTVLTFGDWRVHVEEFLRSAEWNGTGYVAVPESVTNAAFIAVRDAETGVELARGWVASGRGGSPRILDFGAYGLVLADPRPRLFSSEVELSAPGSGAEKATIMVNRPFEYRGWKIYQSSYDDARGAFSAYSVFDVVRDPWIAVVICGAISTLVGAALLLHPAVRKR